MNPKLLEPYHKAEKLRHERTDSYLWMMGSYVFEGVSIALSNIFRKKGQQAKSFREKPYTAIVREEKGELNKD